MESGILDKSKNWGDEASLVVVSLRPPLSSTLVICNNALHHILEEENLLIPASRERTGLGPLHWKSYANGLAVGIDNTTVTEPYLRAAW